MTKLLGSTLSLALLFLISGLAQAGPYFKTILGDPKHPKISASVLYTPEMKFDGAVTNVALVYHKANRDESLIPEKLLDMGVDPVSWTLVEIGFGGDQENAFGTAGLSIDAAPVLLGPLKQILKQAGGRYSAFGNFISSDNGSGVKISLSWKADFIKNGGFVPLNELSFPPRYGIGYTYQF